MQRVSYNWKLLDSIIDSDDIQKHSDGAIDANKLLINKTGLGNDSLGWLDLPKRYQEDEIKRIIRKAEEFRAKSDFLLCIGIGGSYLGAKAGIEFVLQSFEGLRDKNVIFCGHHLNSDYVNDALRFLDDKNVTVNVISKSGTTTEPGVAFRIVKKWMEEKYGKKESASRIVATTDPAQGALRALAKIEGYQTFSIPRDVGGRFSVLTPVGLFPFAYSGLDVRKVLSGANEAIAFYEKPIVEKNMAMQYAIVRKIMYERGKVIEGFCSFQPHLHYLGEWWKQLAGESEGKNKSGIFPSLLDYTTDLHSLGQWMQDGLRNVFETFLFLENTNTQLEIPSEKDNTDNFNYLAGQTMEQINIQAFKATYLAHMDGGVPVAAILLKDRTEETLGQLFYFFQKSIALSGYLMQINPFDQPGVEAYKKNMYALLGKPGYEKHRKAIEDELSDFNQQT